MSWHYLADLLFSSSARLLSILIISPPNSTICRCLFSFLIFQSSRLRSARLSIDTSCAKRGFLSGFLRIFLWAFWMSRSYSFTSLKILASSLSLKLLFWYFSHFFLMRSANRCAFSVRAGSRGSKSCGLN